VAAPWREHRQRRLNYLDFTAQRVAVESRDRPARLSVEIGADEELDPHRFAKERWLGTSWYSSSRRPRSERLFRTRSTATKGWVTTGAFPPAGPLD
jgi:hypothetical protein